MWRNILELTRGEPSKKICSYRWYSEVNNDGKLSIKKNIAVKTAEYAYIVRIDKNRQTTTNFQTFYDEIQQGSVFLTQDYVKVRITLKRGITIHEAHAYPVRNFTKHPKQQKESSINQLNILFINVDSLSHSAAVRSLPMFYEALENDADSIIMKGHTVVGDGTTAQFTGILVGDMERNLPEARRGIKNSSSVDQWPFIFKEYNKKGYATVYSEDRPGTEAFTFRLNGFDAKPTDRYLRPFWRGAAGFLNKRLFKNSPRCHHQLELKFLKRLLMNYKDTPVFSFFAMGSAHDVYANFKLFDEDFLDFHQFLDTSHARRNTLVVWFGDHGARSSKYRATMVGKLEERLPFMAFSFPRWLKNKYPLKFQNFKQNAKIMTSHFDVFSTLKHVLNFDGEFENNHKWGKSLFTNITSLNRTCSEAGILEHWCPCIQYEPMSIESELSKILAVKLIGLMNKKLQRLKATKKLCEPVSLSRIIRVQQITTNDHVRKFSKSFRKGCDGCGARMEDDKKYTSDSYEVVLETGPNSAAYFEATLVQNIRTREITVNGDISRINKYGNQPHCIAEEFPHLRQYCYCKQQLP
ncbi:uncharacterized protein [Clytia hemisphaerica]|uniref:uncharacterized protein n=1 Tax=Clytia hemisphaerica TaxID=252671 RepID=UPI0034D6B80A